MYKELQTKTGAEIFILDKEGPPPGHDEMQRIVVLLGAETQVSHATFEIKTVIENTMSSGHPGGGGRRSGAWTHVGKTYGTWDFSGVGMGPAPMFDVTKMSTDSYAGAGPAPRGVKRHADYQ